MAALDGKVALVTGASKGIGEAVTRRLVARGMKVALVARSEPDLRALADELGPATAPYPCDISDRDQVDATVAAAVGHFGRLDVVFANAGASQVCLVEQTTPASLSRLVETNLLGTLHTVQVTLPHLLSTGGYFLATSTLAAVSSSPGFGAYVASKAGVIALLDALRVELHGRGVDIGILLPGITDTGMLHRALTNDGCRMLISDRSRLLRPVQAARMAAAVERGIRRRASRIVCPRVLWPMVAIPGLFNNPLLMRLAFPPRLMSGVAAAMVEYKTRQEAEHGPRAVRRHHRPPPTADSDGRGRRCSGHHRGPGGPR
jgi:NAD(P)-dependent dehydrogenase (short-subunit alcohol dehydrogenase family)